LRTLVASRLAEHASTPSHGWLGATNVAQVAGDVWASVAPTGAAAFTGLICALAEWHDPGLHPPHSVGHPGGHPLDSDIRAEVIHRQAGLPTTAQPGNTASQARSRLCRRVATLLGATGNSFHHGMSLQRF
jgi:hypothetical protein